MKPRTNQTPLVVTIGAICLVPLTAIALVLMLGGDKGEALPEKKPRDPFDEVSLQATLQARGDAPTRRSADSDQGETEAKEGGPRLVAIDLDALGVPSWMKRHYSMGFIYEGEIPDAAASGADVITGSAEEAHEIEAKEEKLLEHFPGLADRVTARRADRAKETQLFEERGGRGPEQFALDEGVHLDK